ncbi:hypothetical protein ACRRTK_015294 [Alexandromys fortis]
MKSLARKQSVQNGKEASEEVAYDARHGIWRAGWCSGIQKSAKVSVVRHPISGYTPDLQSSRGSFDLSNRVCSSGKLPIGSQSLVWDQRSNPVFWLPRHSA